MIVPFDAIITVSIVTVVVVIIVVVDFVVAVVTSAMKEHKVAIFRRATRNFNSTFAVPRYCSYHVKCCAINTDKLDKYN